MNFIKLSVLVFTLCFFCGCAPKDPSVYDIKSPCVTDGTQLNNTKVPCIRRNPIENHLT